MGGEEIAATALATTGTQYHNQTPHTTTRQLIFDTTDQLFAPKKAIEILYGLPCFTKGCLNGSLRLYRAF